MGFRLKFLCIFVKRKTKNIEYMNNFSYYNPVKIIFGRGTIVQISKEIPQNAKVLMIYGGGSIKKNGVYTQVAEALNGFDWKEFSGIEPNPHYET